MMGTECAYWFCGGIFLGWLVTCLILGWKRKDPLKKLPKWARPYFED